MPVQRENRLREELSMLGMILGETIREIAGGEALQTVEELRRLAWDRRRGVPNAAARMTQFISALNDDQLRVVIRAFTVFLDLANLAEDRQRVRVLRDRVNKAYPAGSGESIQQAIGDLQQAEIPAAEMQQLLDQLHIELVFTAHPTEAKRRSIRGKLRRLRKLLGESDNKRLPAEQERIQRQLRAEIAKLWQTDFIRPWRPTVMQEVQRGLSIKPVLWVVVPEILSELRRALGKVYCQDRFDLRPCVTFGSWIGGDRDGHPDVTSEITAQTFQWLRQAAVEFHLSSCRELYDSFSLSVRQMRLDGELSQKISLAGRRWPTLQQRITEVPPNEVCRRWIAVIQWRLQQTQLVRLDRGPIEAAYATSSELAEDVSALLDAVEAVPRGEFLVDEVRRWLDQIYTFGLHLARLDIRQDARLPSVGERNLSAA